MLSTGGEAGEQLCAALCAVGRSTWSWFFSYGGVKQGFLGCVSVLLILTPAAEHVF